MADHIPENESLLTTSLPAICTDGDSLICHYLWSQVPGCSRETWVWILALTKATRFWETKSYLIP